MTPMIAAVCCVVKLYSPFNYAGSEYFSFSMNKMFDYATVRIGLRVI